MKIRDLNKGEYIIVYDLGKSENSEGMTVIGKVIELEYREDGKNTATIQSMPFQRYTVPDDNYFDYWNDYMESKTERVSELRIKDLNAGDIVQIPNGKMPLEGKVCAVSDLLATVDFPSVGYKVIGDESNFKRVRKARKPLDPNKWLEKSIEENKENTKSVLEAGLGTDKPAFQYKQSNDVQQRKRGEQNVKPDYYQFDDFEMYEIVEAICKHYNPVVAAWIGQAIQYIGRAPRKNGKEDIGKARDMIEQAFKSWD